MADLIAILVLGLQYWFIISIINWRFGIPLPVQIAIPVFIVSAGVGLAVWHLKKSWQTVKQWGRPIIGSLILGIGFLAIDWLLAYLLEKDTNPFLFSGGLLGIPLTFAICPGFTMICVAGLVRAFYISHSAGATSQQEN